MSRAQFIQATAARAKPSIYMNPILLNQSRNMSAEVYFFGEKFGAYLAWRTGKSFSNEALKRFHITR